MKMRNSLDVKNGVINIHIEMRNEDKEITNQTNITKEESFTILTNFRDDYRLTYYYQFVLQAYLDQIVLETAFKKRVLEAALQTLRNK